MKQFAALFFIVCVLLVDACEYGPTRSSGSQPQSDISYFSVGQSKVLGYDTYSIGFDSVLFDDRCILDSPDNCFFGMAETRFWLHKAGEDTTWLNFGITTGDSLWGSGKLLSIDTLGMLFTLVSLDPHPRQNETYRYYEYKAGLIASNNYAKNSSGARLIASRMENQFVRLDDYDVDSAWTNGDSLTVEVTHGGGCSDHYYQLFMNPDGLAKSLPPQADLYVRHFNNFDFCRANVLNKPVFNIDAVKVAYFTLYDRLDTGSVWLNIHGLTDQPDDQFRVLYNFSR